MDATEIKAKMSDLRRGISLESATLVERTRQAFNWKNHVVAHPMVSAAVVGVMGFLLVPQRSSTTVKIPESLAQALANDEQIEIPIPKKPGMIQNLTTAAGLFLARNALGVAMSQLTGFLQRGQAGFESNSNHGLESKHPRQADPTSSTQQRMGP